MIKYINAFAKLLRMHNIFGMKQSGTFRIAHTRSYTRMQIAHYFPDESQKNLNWSETNILLLNECLWAVSATESVGCKLLFQENDDASIQRIRRVKSGNLAEMSKTLTYRKKNQIWRKLNYIEEYLTIRGTHGLINGHSHDTSG